MEDDKKDEGVAEGGTTEPSSDESTEVTEAATDEGYQFDDDLSASSEPASEAPVPTQGGGGGFAEELFTKTVHAKFRTFYIDLKESKNGKFLKVSEKSRGRKSTIMMDAEDVPAIIEALQEAQKQL